MLSKAGLFVPALKVFLSWAERAVLKEKQNKKNNFYFLKLLTSLAHWGGNLLSDDILFAISNKLWGGKQADDALCEAEAWALVHKFCHLFGILRGLGFLSGSFFAIISHRVAGTPSLDKWSQLVHKYLLFAFVSLILAFSNW